MIILPFYFIPSEFWRVTYLHILSQIYISYDNVDKNTSMETFVTDLVVD